MMSTSSSVVVLAVAVTLSGWSMAAAQESRTGIALDPSTRERCLKILRAAIVSDEFWPAMHAAEALSVSGLGAEVQGRLKPLLGTEKDDQKRCGLARELVRAGDLAQVQSLWEVLASPNPYGHVHACESLYKIGEIGDGRQLRSAMGQLDQPKKVLMAAATLSRGGSPEALAVLRKFLTHDDGEIARIGAWVLARTGDRSDWDSLKKGAQRFSDPLTKAYFEHALAALGDAEGRAALLRNLRSTDSAVQIYACEFAPEARATDASDSLIGLLDDDVLDVRVRAAQALLQLAQPAPLDRNTEFMRDVFPATAKNPRYSEGSIAVLRNGRLLYATTEFIDSESDFAAARIVAVESADGGRSWGTPRVLQENVGQKNVMSVTLRRLSHPARYDASLGCFYLVKNSFNDLQVYLRISTDEAKSFGQPILVTNAPGYHVLNNDRVTVTTSGRILVPVATTEDVGKVNHFVCSCVYSDDGGQTWKRSQNTVDYAQRGAMEPEVVELNDGRLLLHFRTQLGHIAVSESRDLGQTWSTARSWEVRAPEAPSTVRRIPATGDLLLVWNDTFSAGSGHGGKRTPLTAAVSADEGKTWTHRRNLETSPEHTFAYTSAVFHQGRALLSYYVRDEKSGQISSRFRSIPVAWFYSSDKK